MATWGKELWDQRDTFDTYTHDSIEFLDKFGNFIKERIRVEQEYAKALRRLSKNYQFKKKEELSYSYQNTFKRFLHENDELAGEREKIAEEIHGSILKEVINLTSTSKTDRRKAFQKLTDCKEQLHHVHKGLLNTKRKYDHAMEEAQTALGSYEHASNSLDYTKAQVLKLQKSSQERGLQADKARDEYKATLDSYNGKQTLYYEVDTMDIINKEIQGAAEKRLQMFAAYLEEYVAINQRYAAVEAKHMDGMIEAAKSCDPVADSMKLIESNKTGAVHPGDLPFEEFLTMHERTASMTRTKKHSKKKEPAPNLSLTVPNDNLPAAERNGSTQSTSSYNSSEPASPPASPIPVFNPPSNKSHTPPPPAPPPLPGQPDGNINPTCTVLYEFVGDEDGLMSIYPGEVLSIVDEDDGSGWTRVMKGEEEGFVPSTYININ